MLGDIPSLRENWNGAAEFADPRDPRAWTQILNHLSIDASRREQLSAQARERAKEFTIDQTVNAYLSAYSELLSVTEEESPALVA